MNLDQFILSLIRKGVTPGISILVGRRDQIIFNRCWGFDQLVPVQRTLNPETIYDLASLTKPLVTALLAAYLCDKKELSLSTDIRRFIPDFPREITIHHLLTHTAGLPAWYPFYLYSRDYLSQLKRLKPVARPGKAVLYSCPGYILLHYLIPRMVGQGFQEFAQDQIIDRLRLKRTFLKVPEQLKKETAPTEEGNWHERNMCQKGHRLAAEIFPWRRDLIRGETHDGNSFYLGGCAGNSGLFSTTSDVFQMARQFFSGLGDLLKSETIQLFWTNLTPFKSSQRTLGFKLNSSLFSSGGRALSPRAIGHSGFTGTSLWLEPENQTTYVLLSNRIHPRVTGVNFDRVRRRIHRLLKRELGL